MIEIGLMWVRTDGKRTVEQVVHDGARRYEQKFGLLPSVCYASSATLGAGVEKVMVDVDDRAVVVWPDPSLPREHFWLGVESCG